MRELNRRSFLQKVGLGIGAAIATNTLSSYINTIPGSFHVNEARKLNVALCGLGNYATNLLAVGLQDSRYCRLAGIVTGTPAKAEIWKKKYNIPDENIYNYQNFDEIKNNKNIDLVYIVLPNSMHKEFVIRSAKAGKHVITEKPMATSVKDCEEMISACKQAGVQLAVGYRLHYEPYNIEIKRLGQQKIFGQVRLIEASLGFKTDDPFQWRLKKEMAGGGPLMDVGVYCIQSCRYVLGEEPVSVTAQFGPVTEKKLFSEVEESITWQLNFPSGATTNSTTSYRANIEHFYAAADEGFFELSPAFSYGPINGKTSKGELRLPHINHQTVQFDGIGKEILENRALPLHITGEEGLKDIRIIYATYEAATTGRKIMLT